MDPTTFLVLLRSDGGNNRTGWNTAGYDALLDAAARAPDTAARLDLLQQAENLLLQELPIVPLFIYTQVRLVSPQLCGWQPNPLDQHPYKYLWIDASGGGCR